MYRPTSGFFINGNVIDGPTLGNEFGLVATQLTKDSEKATQEATKALTDAKAYIDGKLILLTLDGGTF